MTDQEVFDTVAKHLLTQKRKSVDRGRCLYKSNDGAMCAVGCLIPESMYQREMEGHHVEDAVVGKTLSLLGINIHLAQKLQGVHDQYDAEQWKEMLDVTAYCYGLDRSVLANF